MRHAASERTVYVCGRHGSDSKCGSLREPGARLASRSLGLRLGENDEFSQFKPFRKLNAAFKEEIAPGFLYWKRLLVLLLRPLSVGLLVASVALQPTAKKSASCAACFWNIAPLVARLRTAWLECPLHD